MRTNQYIKEINQYSTKLSDKNHALFDEILLKLRFASINNHDAEEFSHHCLALFLQAEETGMPVEELLGTQDINAFCEEFIQESRKNYSFLQKMYWKINYLPLVIFVFTGIFEMLIGYLLKAWVQGQWSFVVPVTVSMLVNTLAAGAVIYILFHKINCVSQALGGQDRKKDVLATVLLWLSFCGMTLFFVLTKLFLTDILFRVHYIFFMGILIAILSVQHVFDNRDR